MNPGLSACEADTLPLSYTPSTKITSLTAIKNILEVMPVDDLKQRDVVILLPVEGDDEKEVLVGVAVGVVVCARAWGAAVGEGLANVHSRAEALDGLGGELEKDNHHGWLTHEDLRMLTC